MTTTPSSAMRRATLLSLMFALAAPGGLRAQARQRRAASQATDSAADSAIYGTREDVMRFADEAAQRQGLDPAWTREALARARFVPAVTRLIMPPPAGTAKNWAAYRARFVEPLRIRAGLAFWAENERWLTLAEERWGVPAAIVVGIVGVETIYGRNTGGFRVLDALATLSFDFPTGRRDRTPFFRSELEAFLRYCQQENIDPAEPLGSYAGAMGMPQFMPSSLLRYGIDFDEDGHIDLQRKWGGAHQRTGHGGVGQAIGHQGLQCRGRGPVCRQRDMQHHIKRTGVNRFATGLGHSQQSPRIGPAAHTNRQCGQFDTRAGRRQCDGRRSTRRHARSEQPPRCDLVAAAAKFYRHVGGQLQALRVPHKHPRARHPPRDSGCIGVDGDFGAPKECTLYTFDRSRNGFKRHVPLSSRDSLLGIVTHPRGPAQGHGRHCTRARMIRQQIRTLGQPRYRAATHFGRSVRPGRRWSRTPQPTLHNTGGHTTQENLP